MISPKIKAMSKVNGQILQNTDFLTTFFYIRFTAYVDHIQSFHTFKDYVGTQNKKDYFGRYYRYLK